MATSFSGGGSHSTLREAPTMGKQLINFINGQLKKFLFLVTAAILNGGRGCRTQF
jgi:hypothetical protein